MNEPPAGIKPDAPKEVIVTPSATFHFPFLADERFLTSPKKDDILALDLPTLTVVNTQRAIDELGIEGALDIWTWIPETEEEMHGSIIPSLGTGARTWSDSFVGFNFDPEHPDIIKNLAEGTGPTMAHELNHVARWKAGKYKTGGTILDGIILEGLGTHYEEHWSGKELLTPYGNALTPEQIREQW